MSFELTAHFSLNLCPLLILSFYAGLNEGDEEIDSEDEDDEEDDDPNKVVDLGDDSADDADLPKKKKAKTAEPSA